MLSSGVLLPDSMFIGMATSMKSNPSCGIERATVPRKMPIDGGEEQIERDAGEEQRHRAGDRHAEQRAHHDHQGKADGDGDDQRVCPDLRHRDLERRHRHDQQVVHRAMLALANDQRRRPG